MKNLKFFSVLLAVMLVAFACGPITPPEKPEVDNGKGTFESPYSVAGALEVAHGKAYVKGTIVGFMVTGDETYPMFSSQNDSVNTNILIADSLVASPEKFMPIQLPKGAVRDGVNTVDNKDNYGKEIILYGEITTYCGMMGVRSVSYAKIGDVEFGEKPASSENVVFQEAFESSLGEFTAVNVSGDQVWAVDTKYKYAMVSGYVSGTNYANEDWLISPAITLPNEATKMTFNTVCRYFSNLKDEATVWVSEDYESGEPSAATWTQLKCALVDASDWTLTKSPEIDLAPYAGKSVRIAFKYVATDKKAGTWELNNVVIERGQAAGGTETGGDAVGAGTDQDPYNVAAAIASQGEEAYVEGYIVGCYNMNASEQFFFGVDTINTNILIADATGSPAVFIPVQLPKGAVRDALNLKDHPDNLGKKVKLYGSLEKYCGKEGLKSVSYAVLDGAEFGLKPQDNSSAIFYESFESSLGGFTVVDEVKDAALAHIWEFSSQYKCAKATGYSGAKLDGCGWMVSPSIDLSGVTTATLTFQNAGNYFVTPADELQVWVSTTATGEVTSFTEGWTQLTVDKYSSGSFSWAISTIALDAYCGQSNVRIAFRYFSTPDMCGTWEIKEFAIK